MDPEDGNDLETPPDGGAANDSASGSDNSAPPAAASGTDNSAGRINDLMSKWQQAEARANAAEAKLAAGAPKDEPADGDTDQSAQAAEFLDYARDLTRRGLFESDPRLAAAGLDMSAITGSTLDEMKASLARQVKLIESISSAERARLLVEHGLDPEVGAGAREEIPGISTMSDEDFAKLLQKRDGAKYG